jgi:hypothetical protein
MNKGRQEGEEKGPLDEQRKKNGKEIRDIGWKKLKMWNFMRVSVLISTGNTLVGK